MGDDQFSIKFYVKGDITELQMKELVQSVKKYTNSKEKVLTRQVTHAKDFQAKFKEIDSPAKAAEIINTLGKKSADDYVETVFFFDFYPRISDKVRPRSGECYLNFRREGDYLTAEINVLHGHLLAEKVSNDEGGIKNQKILLDLCKHLYNLLHPVLGVARVKEIGESIDVTDWVDELKIKNIDCDWFFFGKDYVKKYGKIPLLKIYGAWTTDAFKDGGIMIALLPANAPVELKKADEVKKRFAAVFGIKEW